MTNRVAIALLGLILAALAADLTLNGSDATLFLARKFLDLTDYIAFWR
ncbi:hypothetical protein [Rhodovulum euryhalinum]|uniref:Glyceraldehyde-3-phosphate dehydrogenase n=1 Tax=Rhodovulum euryhalinum TaxID=35805 RepID=A0A4R2KJ22_9RHOB|nr:hypothetical protein [Rhodovulum euryhalinum]TCO70579.1 hypothetical protein EV655_109126 [Rhodovulum euryhalinum]